jgi:signal transduction histidine kinase
MPFHSVLRRQDHEPVNCETVARCYPASMFASSEQSGVSEVYWILELRALDEKENRIVEVISGKNRLLEDHLSNMKELNAHLHQQIAELSAKQKPEEDSQQEKDWAENLMAVSEELNTVRKAKQDAEMRLRVLQNKYNEEINALKNDKVGIITDYQVILQEKQALAEKLQALANVLAELREELAKLQQEHNDAKDAMIRLQDENLALKADNDNLVSANADLSADVAVLKMSYDDVSASAEASQHLQGFTDGLNNELDAKTRECENLSRSVLELEASLSESNDLLGMEKNNLIRQTESFQLRIERLEAQIERLEAENLALQEQHRLALEAQKNDLEQQHKLDLNTVASTQQMLVAAERQKHEEALAALKHEYAEKLAENEAVHQSVSIAYEKSEKELAEARRHLAEREQADVPVSASSHLLSGAVEHLEKIVDIFAESLAELPADLLDSPAVKNMLAGKRLLCQLMDTLNLFSGEFQKASPQSEELLNICQTWQEEFSRKYPSLDLYFKYPVDGKAVFYDLQVRAILRELVENAAEALADQAGAEVKVKIQIKSPEEMAKGHFKQGISQNCLLVQVVDNCQSMFDPEQVVKHYYTNKDGHIGLGLSICQFLLEKMDGELELRSTPNGGVATFYVPLP